MLSRSAALVILAILVWGIVFIVIVPIASSIVAERRWRDETIAKAVGLKALIARRQAIVQDLATISMGRRTGSTLWKGASDVSLAAAVEASVRSYIPADGQALSVSSDAPSSEKGLRHVGIHMDMAMTIPGMTSFFEHVEEARPKLFIDRLSVTAPPGSGSDQPPRTSLECDISAFAEAGATR